MGRAGKLCSLTLNFFSIPTTGTTTFQYKTKSPTKAFIDTSSFKSKYDVTALKPKPKPKVTLSTDPKIRHGQLLRADSVYRFRVHVHDGPQILLYGGKSEVGSKVKPGMGLKGDLYFDPYNPAADQPFRNSIGNEMEGSIVLVERSDGLNIVFSEVL